MDTKQYSDSVCVMCKRQNISDDNTLPLEQRKGKMIKILILAGDQVTVEETYMVHQVCAPEDFCKWFATFQIRYPICRGHGVVNGDVPSEYYRITNTN